MRVLEKRGFGLVAVLLWLTLLASLALGVALATSAEPPATGAFHERLRLHRAAESAVSLALGLLASAPDWTLVPASGLPTVFVDGAAGPRRLGGLTLDLVAETAQRTCGRATTCDDASTNTAAPDRPWGPRNPRWRIVVSRALATVDAVAGAVSPCYVVAWVADDPADEDGDPLRDAPTGSDGHGVLLVRGAAFGEAGGVAELEAVVAQPCRRSGALCPGIRVQSWTAVR